MKPETRASLPYILVTFAFFLGLGTYFTGLSPYVLTAFGSEARWIFVAGQICFPAGYFLSGFLSDRTRRVRALLVCGVLLQAPCQYLFFSVSDSFALSLVFAALTRFFLAFNLQLSTLAILEARGEGRFGSVRTWGTLAFMLIHLALFAADSWWAPAVDVAGAGGVLEISAAESGRLGAFFHLATLFPLYWIIAERQSHEDYFFGDALRVLRTPRVAAFYLLGFCFYFNFQIVDLYLGQFFREIGGMRMVYLGWALVGVLEIPFFPLTARIAGRSGIRALIYISLTAGLFRFGILSLSLLGVEPVPVVYSQLLHGLHFAGFYAAGLYWLRAVYPTHLFGTGVGLFMLLAAAAGAASGNLFYGRLLFSDFVTGFPGALEIVARPEQAGYLPVFALVGVFQIVLGIGFAFLRAPPLRQAEDPAPSE